MNSHEFTAASVRMMAMNLLAMREHSAKELHLKLAKKQVPTELILSVIEKLQKDNLQSDDRFAQAYTAMRLRQGKGAQIIRVDLKEKGIADELIADCLAKVVQHGDWNLMALKAYQKKFGDTPITDLKEKAKRIRFLAARGFSAANIQAVFKHLLASCD